MHKTFTRLIASAIALASTTGVLAADSHKPGGQQAVKKTAAAKPKAQPASSAVIKPKTGQPAGSVASKPDKAAQSAAASSAAPAQATPATASTSPTNDTSAPAESAEAPKPTSAQLLSQAYESYKADPTPATQNALWSAFHTFVAQVGGKTPAAALIKGTPVLGQMGARAVDAGSGRVWSLTRVPGLHQAVVQWADTKANITYVGRRRRTKKVTYTTVWHTQDINIPGDVLLKDARVMGGDDSRSLILVGEQQGASLWLKEFRPTEGAWAETSAQFGSIPSFLTSNVSGRVGFRGADLIFTVARVLPGQTEGLATSVPQAESSTYKFWLHPTESGYILQTKLPDEDQFNVVHQFVDALSSNRTDVAKSLLTDPKLLSIPKYVGLRNPTPAFRVVEMASPPSGALRYRLVTGQKDDLIFDVGRFKDKPVIKAIFIAPPDPFLQEIAAHLPAYPTGAASTAQPES